VLLCVIIGGLVRTCRQLDALHLLQSAAVKTFHLSTKNERTIPSTPSKRTLSFLLGFLFAAAVYDQFKKNKIFAS
jgi:hypothetical protein